MTQRLQAHSERQRKEDKEKTQIPLGSGSQDETVIQTFRVSEKITECLDLNLILKVCHKYALWKINKRWTQIALCFILSPKRAYFTAICRWGLSPNNSHKFYWLSETTVTTCKLVVFQVSAGSEGKILRFSRLFFWPSCSLFSVYSGTKMDYFHSPFRSSGPFSFVF